MNKGDQDKASEHSDRALFLCWPSYSESWAYEAVKQYKGDTVIYIGEGSGGCTGNKDLHTELSRNWKVIETVNIPQWYGIHDYMQVFQRN